MVPHYYGIVQHYYGSTLLCATVVWHDILLLRCHIIIVVPHIIGWYLTIIEHPQYHDVTLVSHDATARTNKKKCGVRVEVRIIRNKTPVNFLNHKP